MDNATASDPARPAFEVRVRTRGYEADATRTVPLPVFVSYLEHLRWESMLVEELGLVDFLHRGHFFVVHEQVLELVRRVGLGVDLVARAILEKTSRFTVVVRHEVVRAADLALVAHARVRGVWLGPDRRPTRLPASVARYAELQASALEALASTEHAGPTALDELPTHAAHATSFLAPPVTVHLPRGLELRPPDAPPPEAWRTSLTVRPSHLDIFAHVNAAQYLRLCDDARHLAAVEPGGLLARAALPAVRSAVKYLQEARVDDVLSVACWPLDERDAFAFELARDAEPVCRARIDIAETRPAQESTR